MEAASLPLTGLRVLDLGWVWSGPMAAAYLADLGAEVIKLEHSDRLDIARLRGAPTINGKKVSIPGKSIELGPYYHSVNRHKLSARLNLKQPEGAELFKALVRKSDVVVENFTPGTLKDLGIDYQQLSGLRPDLVMISLSTAGQTGPISDMRGYGVTLSAYSGLESLVGYPGEDPVGMMNIGFNDPSAGTHALFALLAALYHREQTGEGQYIDLSQLEVGAAPLAEAMLEYQFTGTVPGVSGNGHRLHCPHGIFRCAGEDRWVAISVEQERHWDGLQAATGNPQWAADPVLRNEAGRRAAKQSVESGLAAWTRERDREDVVDRLVGYGVPATPVLNIEEQFADPHFCARGLRQKVMHPLLGEEELYRLPWQMSATPVSIRASAPQLGEHDQYVYGTILGLSAEEIRRLRQEKIIY